jgi:hypothetical protein
MENQGVVSRDHSLTTSFLCTNCAVDFPLNTLSNSSTALTL